MGVNSLPKIVTRQRRGCDLNQGPSAPESSTLTTRLPSHPEITVCGAYIIHTINVCVYARIGRQMVLLWVTSIASLRR